MCTRSSYIISGRRDSIAASVLECEIDRLVYELYELTPEEIAIIEGAAKESSR